MADTVYIRGEGGRIRKHDLPLPWPIQDRIDKGQLRFVNADGSDIASTVAPPVADELPSGSIAVVAAWVGVDKNRARRALDVERAADKPRVTLVALLTELLED
jgi:hypothetical protein